MVQSCIVAASMSLVTSNADAQHTAYDIGIWGAHQGQVRLQSETSANRGFFQNPDIAQLYVSFLSNGVQSLSAFIETIQESRVRTGIWSDDVYLGGGSHAYDARINEHLGTTVVGLETFRNVISWNDLRIGGALGLGYGFGVASIDTKNVATLQESSYESNYPWQALLATLGIRARYTLYTSENYEIGVIAEGRIWSFPYLGPIATSDGYNGPDFRNASAIGYLAGLDVAF